MALCSASSGTASSPLPGKLSLRILHTVDWLRPVAAAIERVVQPPGGGSRSTHVRVWWTASSGVAGRPERGASISPSMPYRS